ncbi:PREDICTED: putative F-box protein At1g30930 [Camelina sativa]|uniref:F-box protein At1g30930 n=1 Tax=Camelina sativa TaxID=90675 RepID=A0ABM0VYE2_CAMSA|nr:PREDICTED: putative F-box protein At1g30930 [Camelina sativa]
MCNPLTGQYVTLPELRGNFRHSYLGFDPLYKEFKVLVISVSYSSDYILTLGTEELRWRTIQCPFIHLPCGENICIHGALYYSAQVDQGNHLDYDDVIVCFDVRYEKFKYIGVECCFDGLINYKGKLGGINIKKNFALNDGYLVELSMWVLEDVDKQEWSKYAYTLWDESNAAIHKGSPLFLAGMTATGDIVLSMKYANTPFYVVYFNPERNTLQSVEIQGVRANRYSKVYAFVDYVEDLSVNDAMQLKPRLLKLVQNFVPKRPKPRRRRRTSHDLSNSSQSVKNKEQNMYGLSANLLYRYAHYHSTGL